MLKAYLVILFLSPILCSAETFPVSCPPEISQKVTVSAPEGWEVFGSEEGSALDRVGFFSGPPAERACLVPDKTVSGKREVRDEWLFTAASEGIWVACFYTGSPSFLAKQLPPSVKRCKVRYKTTKAGGRLGVIEATCDRLSATEEGRPTLRSSGPPQAASA